MSLCTYVCMSIYVCLCVWVCYCVLLCYYVYLCECMYVHLLCFCECVSLCIYVSLCVSMCVSVSVSIYVFLWLCLWICVYVIVSMCLCLCEGLYVYMVSVIVSGFSVFLSMYTCVSANVSHCLCDTCVSASLCPPPTPSPGRRWKLSSPTLLPSPACWYYHLGFPNLAGDWELNTDVLVPKQNRTKLKHSSPQLTAYQRGNKPGFVWFPALAQGRTVWSHIGSDRSSDSMPGNLELLKPKASRSREMARKEEAAWGGGGGGGAAGLVTRKDFEWGEAQGNCWEIEVVWQC